MEIAKQISFVSDSLFNQSSNCNGMPDLYTDIIHIIVVSDKSQTSAELINPTSNDRLRPESWRRMQLTQLYMYKNKPATDTFAWMVVVRIPMLWFALAGCVRIACIYKHRHVFLRANGKPYHMRNASLIMYSAFLFSFLFSMVARVCALLSCVEWMVWCELTNSIFALFLISVKCPFHSHIANGEG